MKHLNRSAALIAGLGLLAGSLTSCSSAGGDAEKDDGGSRTLSVATTGLGRPISYLDDQNELTGYDVEVLRAVDEKLPQYELEFEKVEWEAIFAGLDAGRYAVGGANIAATPEREEKYNSTSPHLRVDYGIVIPEDADPEKITGLDSLAGERTYGAPALNFTKVLEAYNEKHPDAKIQIDYGDLDFQSQFRQLAAGGTDFVFIDRSQYVGLDGDSLGLQFVSLDGEEMAEEYGTSIYTTYLISKQIDDSDQVVEDFDGALEELGEEGRLSELSEEFFGTDLAVWEK